LHGGVDVNIDEIINHVPCYLSFDDNNSLIAPSIIDEFKTTFFQMNSNKSRSLNGLNPTFYKKIWNLCGLYILTTAKT